MLAYDKYVEIRLGSGQKLCPLVGCLLPHDDDDDHDDTTNDENDCYTWAKCPLWRLRVASVRIAAGLIVWSSGFGRETHVGTENLQNLEN